MHFLGKAYSYEEPESSSDSEEDVLRRLQQSASIHSTQLQLPEPIPGPSNAKESGFFQQQSTLTLTRKKTEQLLV